MAKVISGSHSDNTSSNRKIKFNHWFCVDYLVWECLNVRIVHQDIAWDSVGWPERTLAYYMRLFAAEDGMVWKCLVEL